MDDRSPSKAYEADFLLWSEEQARALRDLAGHRELLPNSLDLEHLIEEVEDLGRSEFGAVNSLLRNILVHLIKLACDADAAPVPHWRGEVRAFHLTFLDKITPSMPGRIDMKKLWRQARYQALGELEIGRAHV